MQSHSPICAGSPYLLFDLIRRIIHIYHVPIEPVLGWSFCGGQDLYLLQCRIIHGRRQSEMSALSAEGLSGPHGFIPLSGREPTDVPRGTFTKPGRELATDYRHGQVFADLVR